MRRRHPLPRSAPPAPSDTRSAAPARTPGTRPPGNPPSSVSTRNATDARSRAAGTPEPRSSAPASVLSMRLEPPRPAGSSGQLRPGRHADGNPRAVDPPPAASVARRAPREPPKRRKHGPTPTAAAGPGARHPTSTSSRSSEPTSITNSPRPRPSTRQRCSRPDAAGSVLQPARRRRHIERIVQPIDQLRALVTFGQLDQLPQDASQD